MWVSNEINCDHFVLLIQSVKLETFGWERNGFCTCFRSCLTAETIASERELLLAKQMFSYGVFLGTSLVFYCWLIVGVQFSFSAGQLSLNLTCASVLRPLPRNFSPFPIILSGGWETTGGFVWTGGSGSLDYDRDCPNLVWRACACFNLLGLS